MKEDAIDLLNELKEKLEKLASDVRPNASNIQTADLGAYVKYRNALESMQVVIGLINEGKISFS